MFRLAFSLAGKARRYQQVMDGGVGAGPGRPCVLPRARFCGCAMDVWRKGTEASCRHAQRVAAHLCWALQVEVPARAAVAKPRPNKSHLFLVSPPAATTCCSSLLHPAATAAGACSPVQFPAGSSRRRADAERVRAAVLPPPPLPNRHAGHGAADARGPAHVPPPHRHLQVRAPVVRPQGQAGRQEVRSVRARARVTVTAPGRLAALPHPYAVCQAQALHHRNLAPRRPRAPALGVLSYPTGRPPAGWRT